MIYLPHGHRLSGKQIELHWWLLCQRKIPGYQHRIPARWSRILQHHRLDFPVSRRYNLTERYWYKIPYRGKWSQTEYRVKFSAEDILKFFSYFPKTGFDISCKLSPVETICTKCQILFSGKNKKKISPICLGPVVQSVVSLTSSLRIISLTVLVDSIHNILIFFAEKMWVPFALQKLLTCFQQKISAYLRITRCKF